MKAVRLEQYGGADVLQLQEISKPVPQAGDILIRMKAAALNPVDSKIRSGAMKENIPMVLPFTPGWEGAGVVEAVGGSVTEFKAGDKVITRVPFAKAGADAEYMLAAESEVIHKPASLSFSEAAALSVVGSAAYTLLQSADLKAGQTVFILGAAGSVGLIAVHLAKKAGATVIATAKGDDRIEVLAEGADEVLDYTATNYSARVRDVDLALDLVGGPAQEALWPMLRKGGLLLSTAMPPSPEKAARWGVRASFHFTQNDKQVMETVAGLVSRGEIRIKIGQTLPLAEIRKAHLLMDERRVSGKIILTMD